MLMHLPDGYKPEQVAPALAAKIRSLPEMVRRSLTWDQGPEMRDWKQVAAAADIEVFFCDPHKPWQQAVAARHEREASTALLRQYFPKGSDLSVHSAAGPGLGRCRAERPAPASASASANQTS